MHLTTIARRATRHVTAATLVATVLFVASSQASPGPTDLNDYSVSLTVDQNVVARGVGVTVYLNGFAANQRYVVYVAPEQLVVYTGQGPAPLNLPVSMDANGSGATIIPTGGLASGTYFVGVATDGGAQPVLGARAAFGVIDPGTIGPRKVRLSDE